MNLGCSHGSDHIEKGEISFYYTNVSRSGIRQVAVSSEEKMSVMTCRHFATVRRQNSKTTSTAAAELTRAVLARPIKTTLCRAVQQRGAASEREHGRGVGEICPLFTDPGPLRGSPNKARDGHTFVSFRYNQSSASAPAPSAAIESARALGQRLTCTRFRHFPAPQSATNRCPIADATPVVVAEAVVCVGLRLKN